MGDKHIVKNGATLTPHWLSAMAASFSDQNLATMFEEIVDFHNTGVLEGNKLRSFASEIAKKTNDNSSSLRMAENAALVEMARRYYGKL